MSYDELVDMSIAIQQAISNKRDEAMKEVARAYQMALALGITEEEMKAFLDKESASTEVCDQESPALPEPIQAENVTLVEEQDSINSENKEEEESKVEKAIELANTLPLAEGIDDREPYFVTYDFAVSKKGELSLDAETFGRNETAEMISKIKVERMSYAKLLHATDVVSTDDCTAYMWYEGKYITVTFYRVPVKETTGTGESEETLPSMDSLLSDDPEYKEYYAPKHPEKKSDRTLPTMDELLSGEPINRILCLGNEVPDDKAYKQHYRISHVDGIIPTETATGQTIIYIPPVAA